MAKLGHAERSEISKKAWRERKPKAVCAFCGKKIWVGGVKSPAGRPFHKGCLEAYHAGLVPAQVGKNPSLQEHRTNFMRIAKLRARSEKWGRRISPFLEGKLAQEEANLIALGISQKEIGKMIEDSYTENPRRITGERRVPRDAYRFGARELNPQYKFGPTRFRPPAGWFAKISQGTAASYFGKKLKELSRAEATKVGQIVGGIWAKYSDATRLAILRKYEPAAVRVVRNLPCPICGTLNPVSQVNLRMRCPKCGTPLRSVKVRRR